MKIVEFPPNYPKEVFLARVTKMMPTLERLLENRPELILDLENIKLGTETVVIPCTFNGQKCALRIGNVGWDAQAMWDFSGIEGIPKLIEELNLDGESVAILVEFIEGKPFPEFASEAAFHEIVQVLHRIKALVRRVHERGFLMPEDSTKTGNILIDGNNQPFLVDVGDHRRLNRKGMPPSRKRDDRRLHHNLGGSSEIKGIWQMIMTRAAAILSDFF